MPKKIKIYKCPWCNSKDIKEVVEKEIPPYNECPWCNKTFPTHVEFITKTEKNLREKAKYQKKLQRKKKQEKIIETYLDLASTIQNAGGCVSLLKEFRDKPLSEFLEEVCSTNNIRFKHDKDGT